MNFSTDIVLKSDGFFPNYTFLLKKCRRHLPCCSLHDLLVVMLVSSYADACSDLGHQIESLRWASLRGIRRFFKNKNKQESLRWASLRGIRRFFKNKNKQIDLAHERISNASLCISFSKIRFSHHNLP